MASKDTNQRAYNNHELIERVYELQRMLIVNGSRQIGNIGKTILPLLQYPDDLRNASKEKLAKMGNAGKDIGNMLYRLFQGESADEIFGKGRKKGDGLAGKIEWTS